ncbi:MAG: cation:proton antiporter [Deltaproteobacteria bacterium]|nr:cation:proton antiporter [Deltaproteobacteria bacterium]
MEIQIPLVVSAVAGGAEHSKIPLVMLLVFGSAKLLAEVCQRVKQPGLVGEILAGIILGPSVLGWVAPDEMITTLAELGVMFLLFRVGLEIKASELLQVGITATLVATLGVLLPFALGWGILVWWGGSSIEALFVGAAMVATSVGITARVLATQGVLQARASRVILAAAVIDDVLGLLILAVVSSAAQRSINILGLVATAVFAIGFTLGVAFWGTKTVGRVVARAEDHLHLAEGQFVLALCLLFGLALLAVYAGVAAIIGAFLAGITVAESVTHRVHELTQGVTELLVPFFLVGIGLHFDVAAFATPSTLVLAVVILLAAILSKLLGCALGAVRLGRADALRIGIGMVPRGEVGMVVAQIGLGLAVIPQGVFAVVVFMSIMTTLIAPPLLNWAYRDVEAATTTWHAQAKPRPEKGPKFRD